MKSDTMKELYKEFESVSQREGFGGQSFKYIKGATIIHRLNQALKNRWSFEVINVFEKDSFIVVHGRLSLFDDEDGTSIVRDAFGSRFIEKYSKGPKTGMPIDLGNAYKGAETDALKKAASMLGVGLYQLYDVDEEEETPEIKDGDIEITEVVVEMPKAEPVAVKPEPKPEVQKPRPLDEDFKKDVPKPIVPPPAEEKGVTMIQPVQKISIERNAKMKGLNVDDLIVAVLGAPKSLDTLTWAEAVSVIREGGKARLKSDLKENVDE